jgi:hypothetical protein
LDGIQYFRTTVKGAGSFVKATRKRDEESTMERAIANRYFQSDNEDFSPIKVARSKVIETVGIDKIARYHAQLSNLETISLSRHCIKGVGDLSKFMLDSIRRLDLSYNLFTKFATIVDVIGAVPKLECLILNGNRFLDYSSMDPIYTELKELSLSSTLISETEIHNLLNMFRSVKVINLSHNRLKSFPSVYCQLDVLDLSWNMFTDMSSLTDVNALEINLSHNNIDAVSNTLMCTELNLGYNQIVDWCSIDLLSRCLLKGLRLNGNPVHDSDDAESFVLGRCATIGRLNGSIVADSKRLDAELYFMSKVASAKHKYDTNSSRWKQLCAQNGEPATRVVVTDTIRSRLLSLQVEYNGRLESIKVLKSISVQKLKVMAAKKFGLSPLDVVLHRQGHESHDPQALLSSCGFNAGDVITIELQ